MVVIQLEATMNMMQVKYVPLVSFGSLLFCFSKTFRLILPIRGVVSVTGSMSPTIDEKIVIANIIVTPAIDSLFSSFN